MDPEKPRAPRNRTLTLEANDRTELLPQIRTIDTLRGEPDEVICADAFDVLPRLKNRSFDLLFADPPYNLTKTFGEERFRATSTYNYEIWLRSWLELCRPLLKETASVYICADWRSSAAVQRVGSDLFILRNRITWEREKGRGARMNWKNAAEDIWFFTVSDRYIFNIDAVRQRRRVLAPYRENGEAKDWNEEGKFRDTAPSNIWTDISVPFWSMPENTDHPTQKPEKLLAKIILASTNPGDVILDPFAGSGTTAVVSKKLDRRCIAIERDENYCLLAQKRLDRATAHRSIQGLVDGVFWERNSSPRKD